MILEENVALECLLKIHVINQFLPFNKKLKCGNNVELHTYFLKINT